MQFSPEDPLQARILEALAARSSSRGGTPNGGASPFPYCSLWDGAKCCESTPVGDFCSWKFCRPE